MVQYCWNLVGRQLWRTGEGATSTTSSNSCQIQTLIFWGASESLEAAAQESSSAQQRLKQTLQSNDELNSHSHKLHQWFPKEEPELALSSPWSRWVKKAHKVRITHSYPRQTSGPHPTPISISFFVEEQLWCFLLYLFPLTPPQRAYVFVFLCLHIYAVPKGMHTLSLRLGTSHYRASTSLWCRICPISSVCQKI